MNAALAFCKLCSFALSLYTECNLFCILPWKTAFDQLLTCSQFFLRFSSWLSPFPWEYGMFLNQVLPCNILQNLSSLSSKVYCPNLPKLCGFKKQRTLLYIANFYFFFNRSSSTQVYSKLANVEMVPSLNSDASIF